MGERKQGGRERGRERREEKRRREKGSGERQFVLLATLNQNHIPWNFKQLCSHDQFVWVSH